MRRWAKSPFLLDRRPVIRLRLDEWSLRFILVASAKREIRSRVKAVDGKRLYYWRSRRQRAARTYTQRFGTVPSAYERQMLYAVPDWETHAITHATPSEP